MSDTALEIKEKHPSLQEGTQLCLTTVSFESTVLLLGKLSFVRFDPIVTRHQVTAVMDCMNAIS